MEILKKHSALVSITNKELNITQRKTLNVFYLKAKEALEAGQSIGNEFTIEVTEIERLIGLKKNDRARLLDELWKITKFDVEYNVFEKDKKVEWGRFGLLSNDLVINYDENGKGILTYRLSKKIEENLILPNIFAKVDLELIRELKSKYAVPFYELLEDYKNVNVPYMTIEKLKDFLGIDEDKYKLFSDLRKWVIEVIKEEINEKTSFTIDYELKKNGKKIIGIQWRIVEYDDSKQTRYFEKLDFINMCRENYREGEILLDDRESQGVVVIMGKNGLLAKKYNDKPKAQTIKKDLALGVWNWLFTNQLKMEKPRGLFRI